MPVVWNAWIMTVHPKEKVGAVTAWRLLHLFQKVLASPLPTVHAKRLLDLPTVNAPVAGNRSNHLPVFSRPSARSRLLAKMEFEVSVETESGEEVTAS